jgi:hypothetical protein
MKYKVQEVIFKNASEPLGTKEKYWIIDNKTNIQSLFKIGRENTGEDWAEKVAYEIGYKIGLPVAEYELAIYEDTQGTLSKSFVKENDRLIHGNELLAKVDKNYPIDRFYKVREYKLETVLNLMKILQIKHNIKDALHNFIGYIIFDCLIANQDRHHENWGFILSGKIISLAPSYDHASGFGCKVSDDEIRKRLNTKDKNYDIKAFCKKAKTPFYDFQSNKINTIKSCEIVIDYDKASFCYWLDKISSIDDNVYVDIFSKIPDEFISKMSIKFAIKVIKENKQRLIMLKNKVCN